MFDRFDHRFKNWSETHRFQPEEFVRPRSESEIKDIVRKAARDRKVVRTQGAGHSFSQIVTCPPFSICTSDLESAFKYVVRISHSVSPNHSIGLLHDSPIAII